MRATWAMLGTIGSLAMPIAHAQWAGKGEIGALVSRGNADATSANVKLEVAHENPRWKNSLFVGGLYSRNATFTTAQRIEGRGQADHKVGEHAFWRFRPAGQHDVEKRAKRGIRCSLQRRSPRRGTVGRPAHNDQSRLQRQIGYCASRNALHLKH